MEKKEIIPEEIKGCIDEVLEKELFNANRYYAESNPNISFLMSKELEVTPSEFLRKLKARWMWHNHFYEELLEPAYLQLTTKEEGELSPRLIDELMAIYNCCCLVDESTLIMSASIKHYLDNTLEFVLFNVEDNQKDAVTNYLLTCRQDNFFVQYRKDHLTYILLTKIDSVKAKEYKNKILKKYHAYDEKIFEGRFKEFQKYMPCSIQCLFDELSLLEMSDDFRLKQRMAIIRDADKLAFNGIVQYDNIDEKLIAKSLIGISGYLFRKKVLKYLNDSNILLNDGDIYGFSNETIIDSLKELRQLRRMKMDKNIEPLRQKGPTCAIMCLLMTLKYYNVIPKVNWYDEKKYYRTYKSRYMEGTPFSALTFNLARNGLETILLHSENNYFSNEKGYLDDYTYTKAMEEYKMLADSSIRNGAIVKNGVEITSEIIRQALEEDYLIILAGMSSVSLHSVLISGYDNDKFIVCNPLSKTKQKWDISEMEKYIDTPIGKWCILVKEKTKEKSDLLQSLESYEKEGLELTTVDCEKRKKL